MDTRNSYARADFGRINVYRKPLIALAIIPLTAAILFNVSAFAPDTFGHEAVEMVGLALIALCIIGRTWSSMYIGGRKIETIVAEGPYSVVRNPLYVFSIIGAVGIGMQLGSVTAGVLLGALTLIFFYLMVLGEERVLLELHGAPYRDYLKRVPRFLPDFSLWHDQETLRVSPRYVRSTFIDALFFLIAVPAFEALEGLQNSGALPIFFKVY
ncbi:MAG: isoprenylcysteine carboxylmethyltransferase family protein [Flavobacteriaceae bacterium]